MPTIPAQAVLYGRLAGEVLARRTQRRHDPESLDLSAKLLALNPEVYTVWNYRRASAYDCGRAPRYWLPALARSVRLARCRVPLFWTQFNLKSLGGGRELGDPNPNQAHFPPIPCRTRSVGMASRQRPREVPSWRRVAAFQFLQALDRLRRSQGIGAGERPWSRC